MKVVHLCCVAPPEGGGMGVVASQEVAHLRELGVEAVLVAPSVIPALPSVIPAKAGIQYNEINSIGSPSSASGLRGDDDLVLRLPSLRIGNVARLMGLDKIIQDADVVHLHYPFYFTAGMVARWRRKNRIKKLVITLHMDATDKGWRWLAAALHRKFFQKRVLNSADLLLVSTLDYAEHSSFAPWVGSAKLHELPFGVNTEVFRPSAIPGVGEEPAHMPGGPVASEAWRARHRDDKIVGMIGVMDRAHPFKGVDVLLCALAKLPPNVHGLFIGDGDRKEDYQKMAADLGISERSHFVGRLDRAKLIEAMQNMDVFAFPSTSRAEAFGLALLEAMACGLPVVASDLPGVRMVAKDAGLTVPIKDPENLAKNLRRLLDDQVLRQSLALAARDKALSYNWDNHVKKLIEFYNQIPPVPLEGGKSESL